MNNTETNTTTTTAPPALPRAVPRLVLVPIFEKRPCGRLLYEIADERLRVLAKRAIGFESLTPAKLAALRELGVSFVEVDAPAT